MDDCLAQQKKTMLPPAELNTAFEAITKHAVDSFQSGLKDFKEVSLALALCCVANWVVAAGGRVPDNAAVGQNGARNPTQRMDP